MGRGLGGDPNATQGRERNQGAGVCCMWQGGVGGSQQEGPASGARETPMPSCWGRTQGPWELEARTPARRERGESQSSAVDHPPLQGLHSSVPQFTQPSTSPSPTPWSGEKD